MVWRKAVKIFDIHLNYGNMQQSLFIQDYTSVFIYNLTGQEELKQSIVHVTLVVRDYDEAIEFYTKKLHFTLVEDTYQPEQDKRWVVVAPPGSRGTTLLLARASTVEQEAFIGQQTGGRVFLFLNTDDFWRDYNEMVARGIHFVRQPKTEPYGTVAVFEDLYGNQWDLLELKNLPSTTEIAE